MSTQQPNVFFIMTDQQRFDTLAGLGNPHIYTPNYDRLIRRGISFSNAYSTCPVCIPARYTIRTGCEPPTLRIFSNFISQPSPGQAETMEGRCGPYLARTMTGLGYRTFGIGKFHSNPTKEDLGYETHLHSEEIYGSPEARAQDNYAAWLAKEYPEYDTENLMGERTEMYYIPQRRPMPAHAAVESWAADRAVEQLQSADTRPYFGMVSFIGPHPPFSPPIPFNRMYDPDRMPNPVKGDIEHDHFDPFLPYARHLIWAEDIHDPLARILKARYYGEISYIDACLGRILDAVEARPDAKNTLICFFSDHGDHLGDHHAWQKESFFEASCHIPFLLSWPAQLPAGVQRDEIVCLTDLFGIATHAAGKPEPREGIDVLGMLNQTTRPREFLIGMYGEPGTPKFKIMVRTPDWKYIFIANGNREQLFDMTHDRGETINAVSAHPHIARNLRDIALSACRTPGAEDALENETLKTFSFQPFEKKRCYQMDKSRGANGFPEKPEDVFT